MGRMGDPSLTEDISSAWLFQPTAHCTAVSCSRPALHPSGQSKGSVTSKPSSSEGFRAKSLQAGREMPPQGSHLSVCPVPGQEGAAGVQGSGGSPGAAPVTTCPGEDTPGTPHQQHSEAQHPFVLPLKNAVCVSQSLSAK